MRTRSANQAKPSTRALSSNPKVTIMGTLAAARPPGGDWDQVKTSARMGMEDKRPRLRVSERARDRRVLPGFENVIPYFTLIPDKSP